MGTKSPVEATPMEQARALMARKDAIEAEINVQASILKANDCNMQTPLVDSEGFPRADVDIYAVRGARVRIIELRNDLKTVMDGIAKALQGVFDPSLAVQSETAEQVVSPALKPFARVSGVLPGSPASEAGIQRDDLLIKFGPLTRESFTSTALQPLAEHVAANENRHIVIRILRAEEVKYVTLTPRNGWGGRGMLGCHIVPYTPS